MTPDVIPQTYIRYLTEQNVDISFMMSTKGEGKTHSNYIQGIPYSLGKKPIRR